MSEVVFPDEPVDKLLSGLSAGLMLRNAREAAGVHIAALAVSMKIPVKKLEALESDRLDLLHDAVFARALASSVCRTLKIDPEPVLAKLPSNAVPRLNTVERKINAPFHSAGYHKGHSLTAIFAKPHAWIVLASLVGIAAAFLFPAKTLVDPSYEQLIQVPVAAIPPEPVSVEKPIPSAEAVPPVAVSPRNADVAQDSLTVMSPQLEVTQSLPAPAPQEMNRERVVPSVGSTGTVVFKAKADSWVKVVDSNGLVLLSRTLTSGEVISPSGAVPLSIVIGRADAVDVEVGGKPLSMTAVAKDNVARFEVK